MNFSAINNTDNVEQYKLSTCLAALIQIKWSMYILTINQEIKERIDNVTTVTTEFLFLVSISLVGSSDLV